MEEPPPLSDPSISGQRVNEILTAMKSCKRNLSCSLTVSQSLKAKDQAGLYVHLSVVLSFCLPVIWGWQTGWHEWWLSNYIKWNFNWGKDKQNLLRWCERWQDNILQREQIQILYRYLQNQKQKL